MIPIRNSISDSTGKDLASYSLSVATVADIVRDRNLAAIVTSNELYMRSVAGEMAKAFREDGVVVGLIVDPSLKDMEWYLIIAE